MEAKAIQQDLTAGVRFGESTSAGRVALLMNAKERWHAAASEYEIHRVSHFSKG
jgi:hypothetical protein